MRTTIENITPSEATLYLENNTSNRPLNQRRVADFAQQMREGAWRLSHEGIAFSDGVLIDGQHRLMAVIQSGVTIQIQVTRGLPLELRNIINTGKSRTARDVFSFNGITRCGRISAAVGVALAFECGFRAGRKGTPNDYLTFYQSHEREFLRSISVVGSVSKNVMSDAWAIGLHLCLARRSPRADDFILGVLSGSGLAEGTPVFVLRRVLMQDRLSSKHLSRKAVGAVCVKAWNMFLAGKQCGALRFLKEEAFPEIDGDTAS